MLRTGCYNCAHPLALADLQWVMSNTGIDYLQYLEGCSLVPYPDGDGFAIGWGHFIEPGEEWMMYGISQAQADQIFYDDVYNAEQAVNAAITGALSQEMFDALCMFAFNIGYTNFKNTSLAKMINAGSSDQDIFDFWLHTWVGSPVNAKSVARREKEAQYGFPGLQASKKGSGYGWLALLIGGAYIYSHNN